MIFFAKPNQCVKRQPSPIAPTIVSLAITLASCQSGAQTVYKPYTFTTLAGNTGYGFADGTGSGARFNAPAGIAVDSEGNLYVADSGNSTIRRITPTGVVATLAGRAGQSGSLDGTGGTARFNGPQGVAVDNRGTVYVADTFNHTIRQITLAGVVTTLAGMPGSGGSADGTGSNARFYYPGGVAVDSSGNVYVADTSNQTIRKVMPTGVVTTFAGLAGSYGSVDGTNSVARFWNPSGVAVDGAGNVYVADTGNLRIRQVTPSGAVTTLTSAVYSPYSVGLDTVGNVYVGDKDADRIQKVAPDGVVTTLAGVFFSSGSADGTGPAARFSGPWGVAVDRTGNVYVADSGNNTIRKVSSAGVVRTLAGLAGGYGSADGTGSAARFNYVFGAAVDPSGNIYVADAANLTIRKITPSGVVTTLAGSPGQSGSTDGTGAAARFGGSSFSPFGPWAVATDTQGDVYVADTYNQTIRKVTPAGVVTTLAGLAGSAGTADGTGSAARFGYPFGVAVDGTGNIYVTDDNGVRLITPLGVVTTLTGITGVGFPVFGVGGGAVAVDSAGNLYLVSGNSIEEATPAGSNWITFTLASGFCSIAGLAVDSAGNVYVADQGCDTILQVTGGGDVTTLAGLAGSSGSADGTGSAARFYWPVGVAVDGAGNLYVADWGNGTIRKGVPASTIPSPVLVAPSSSASQFAFGLSGLPGLAVDMEASADLSNWQLVGTYILTDATNYFLNPTSLRSAQFYRARVR